MTEDAALLDSVGAMSEKDFSRLGEFFYQECGIKITGSKKTMLEARLQRRLRALGLSSFSSYCDYLFRPDGKKEELTQAIDAVTTNKTDFFREPAHFHYLIEQALPELVGGAFPRRMVTAWSAGCSTGEEPYTLAMVMERFGKTQRNMDFTILATDISTRVLEKAKLAIYDEERIQPVPTAFRKAYLLKSKDSSKKIYRIIPELREKVEFKRLNFMDGDFGLRERMEVIFCRNVIIYFDKGTQERVLNRLCGHLSAGGYLFVGHSETLLGMDVPLVQVAPTIYRKES
jgi:chemotaxis protein methyltransferase CheR